MSGREGQGGQDQGQSQSQSQGGKQNYVVKTTFTDAQGKQWTAGTAFQGDEAAIRKALAAGQIEEQPA